MKHSPRPIRFGWLLYLGFCCLGITTFAVAGEPQELAPRLRLPIAMELAHDQQFLLVANRRSGSISQIDLAEKRTVGEYPVGRQLSDLESVPGTSCLLATDEAEHQLIVMRFTGSDLTVVQRVPVSQYPVSVAVSADGQSAYVASLWSRRLTVVNLTDNSGSKAGRLAKVAGTVDLPFAPREQICVDAQKRLIVADSFGGQYGVIDTETNLLVLVDELHAHNIRGLGVSADGQKLIVAQQMLNEVAHTVHNDVHWGLLMSNDLRWLKLDAVLDKRRWLYQDAHMVPLGGAGNATGDPAELAVAADGRVVVALAGVGEIAFGRERDYSLYRVDVGRRPTAVEISGDGRTAYVANTLDDTVSLVDLESRQVRTVALGKRPRLALADRGERLFFDANLSHDGWMSCHSCHTDGHTNGLLNDNLSDGSYGAPKRVLSLLGRQATAPFAWDGSTASLADQIRNSITHTMRGDKPPTDDQITALAAYVQTLAAPPPLDKARGERDEQAVLRGQAVFESQKCNHCHTPPNYTSPRVYNVGLTDEKGNNRFNPPSLIGAGQRSAYLHDGRAKSLEDVFHKYEHKLSDDASEEQVRDLTAFLRSL